MRTLVSSLCVEIKVLRPSIVGCMGAGGGVGGVGVWGVWSGECGECGECGVGVWEECVPGRGPYALS